MSEAKSDGEDINRQDGAGMTKLHEAAAYGQLAEAKDLVRSGARTDIQSYPILLSSQPPTAMMI